MGQTEEDCNCKKKLCDCCNGTGHVPQGKQRRPNWWIQKGPVSPETFCPMLFEKCSVCNGSGKVKK